MSYIKAFKSYPLTDILTDKLTCGHFRSFDKDGGHTIWSAILKTPCHTQTSWLYLFQNGRAKFTLWE